MGHHMGDKAYWKTSDPKPDGFPGSRLGGRGKCRHCGGMANNVAYHEAHECSLRPGKECPYGFCPHCGAPGKARERRPNGDDLCERGHRYPSRDAVRP